jgi:hypothetical protein
VYQAEPGTHVNPEFLVKRLYALPHGADFQDGGQHDCQEALRSLIQALHDDLVRPGPCHLLDFCARFCSPYSCAAALIGLLRPDLYVRRHQQDGSVCNGADSREEV